LSRQTNKQKGPMHYTIGVSCVTSEHVMYTLWI